MVLKPRYAPAIPSLRGGGGGGSSRLQMTYFFKVNSISLIYKMFIKYHIYQMLKEKSENLPVVWRLFHISTNFTVSLQYYPKTFTLTALSCPTHINKQYMKNAVNRS